VIKNANVIMKPFFQSNRIRLCEFAIDAAKAIKGSQVSKRADTFLKNWISENVHGVPGLEDQRQEVARLVAKSIVDAAIHGIDASELNDSAGDLEDYLEAAYINVHDPDAGGFCDT
jgi:arginine deiminase